MIAVGLDLSVRCTGWAVWGGPTGLVRTDLAATKHLKGIARRRYIADMVGAVIHDEAGAWRIVPKSRVLVVIENHVAGAKTRQTAIILGQLHAVVLDTLATLRCPIVYVAPATAKKALAGKGGASKDEMIAAAQRCGYEGAQTDEADAWGLALIGHHLLGGSDHLTPHRASCLAAVEWVVPLPEVSA